MQHSLEASKSLEPFREFLETTEGHRLFPNKHSGTWFIRTHAHELIEAGVLVKLLGKFHIIQPDFVPTLIALLQEKTKKSLIEQTNNQSI